MATSASSSIRCNSAKSRVSIRSETELPIAAGPLRHGESLPAEKSDRPGSGHPLRLRPRPGHQERRELRKQGFLPAPRRVVRAEWLHLPHHRYAATRRNPGYPSDLKLNFQSLPGLYVTANLYLPKNLTGQAPAILYVCGHGPVIKNGVSYGNKVSYQHHGAWFAQNGYICLIIDTLQLGEIQGIHPI